MRRAYDAGMKLGTARRSVAFAISFALVFAISAPAYAQTVDLKASFKHAVTAASSARAPQRAPMSPALKWTGIGLLGAGALYLILGASIADCDGGYYYDGYECGFGRAILYTFGGMLVGAGGIVLAIGVHKANHPSPTISFVPRGVMVKQTLSFGKKR